MIEAIRRQMQHTSLWLAALLFVGQVLAVAHATQHEIAAQGDQISCEICIVAHGGGGAPATVQAPELPRVESQPLIAYLPAPLARRAIDRPRSRAPPLRSLKTA
jgi:hypothetical protein